MEGKQGEKIRDFVGIAERVEEFYRELFRKGEVDEESMRSVLEKVEVRVSEDDREMCEGNIGTGEIEAAIAGLGRNKSPGIDGIIGEFYIEFREELVPVLDRLFKWIEEKDEMVSDMSTGLISIIYRVRGRSRRRCSTSRRPLYCSLMWILLLVSCIVRCLLLCLFVSCNARHLF